MAAASCSCGPEDRQRRVLMVRRLHPSVTMPALLQAFGTHGSITGCKVFTHKSGRSAGCASVEFSTHAAACAALRSLNNTMLHGKAVQLAWYNPAHTTALQAVTASQGDAAAAGVGQLQLGLAALVGDQQSTAVAALPLELQLQLLQLQQQQNPQQQQQVAGDIYTAAAAAAAVQQAAAAALTLPRAPSASALGFNSVHDAQQQQQLATAAAALGLGGPSLLAASTQHQPPSFAAQQHGPALLAAGLTTDELIALQLAQQQRRSHSQVPLLDRPPSGFTAASPILAQQQPLARSDPGGLQAAAQQPSGRLPSPSLPPAVPRTSSATSLQPGALGAMAGAPQQRVSTDGGMLGGGLSATKAASGRASLTGGWPTDWGASSLHAERATSLPLPMAGASQPGHGSSSGGGVAAPIAGSAPISGGRWLPPGLPAPPTPTGHPRSASQQSPADGLGALPHTPDPSQSTAVAAAAQYLALVQQQAGQQEAVLAAAAEAAAAALAVNGGDAFLLRPSLLADNSLLLRQQQQQLEQLQVTADILRSLGGAVPPAATAVPPLVVNRSSPSPIPPGPGRSPSRGGCAATAAAAAAAASLPGWDPLWSPTRAPSSAAAGGPPPALARSTDEDAAAQRGPDSPRDPAARKQQLLFKQQVAAAMGIAAPLRVSPSPRGARASSQDDAQPDAVTAGDAEGQFKGPPLPLDNLLLVASAGADSEAAEAGDLIGTEVVADRLLPASLLQGSGDSGDLAVTAPIGVPSLPPARSRVAALRGHLTGSMEGSFSHWMALEEGGSGGVRDSSGGGGGAGAEDWPLLRAAGGNNGGVGRVMQQQPAFGMTRHSSICLDACLVHSEVGTAAPGDLHSYTALQLDQGQRISHAFQMPSFMFASPSGPGDGASVPLEGQQPPARPATAEPSCGRAAQWMP